MNDHQTKATAKARVTGPRSPVRDCPCAGKRSAGLRKLADQELLSVTSQPASVEHQQLSVNRLRAIPPPKTAGCSSWETQVSQSGRTSLDHIRGHSGSLIGVFYVERPPPLPLTVLLHRGRGVGVPGVSIELYETDVPLAPAKPDTNQAGPGPTEPCTGCSRFLLSSGFE